MPTEYLFRNIVGDISEKWFYEFCRISRKTNKYVLKPWRTLSRSVQKIDLVQSKCSKQRTNTIFMLWLHFSHHIVVWKLLSIFLHFRCKVYGIRERCLFLRISIEFSVVEALKKINRNISYTICMSNPTSCLQLRSCIASNCVQALCSLQPKFFLRVIRWCPITFKSRCASNHLAIYVQP